MNVCLKRYTDVFVVGTLIVITACSGPQSSPVPSGTSVDPGAVSQGSPAGSTDTIDFNGLNKNGQPFTKYSEFGFTVTAVQNPNHEGWVVDDNYGDPAPMITFNAPAGRTISNSVNVTSGNGTKTFRFHTVDFYSSVAPVKWKLMGVLNAKTVFTATGQTVNPMGGFVKVQSPHQSELITRINITMTDVVTPCCSNPLGMDNLVVSP